ncbi:MAG: thioredoxin fold domain-containing protein [Oscillospiraceae bacterium]|jgi:thioredoxin 1|nr:thioredoxin fold domain-containing protein [Oscillospiraceae bacterium]
MPIAVQLHSFAEEVLAAEMPVLVDFWAVRCMPCRVQKPILQELAEEFADRLKICAFNVDQEDGESEDDLKEKFRLILEYHVMNLPTMLLFRRGEVVRTLVGLHQKEELLEILAEEGLLPELNEQDAGNGKERRADEQRD